MGARQDPGFPKLGRPEAAHRASKKGAEEHLLRIHVRELLAAVQLSVPYHDAGEVALIAEASLWKEDLRQGLQEEVRHHRLSDLETGGIPRFHC